MGSGPDCVKLGDLGAARDVSETDVYVQRSADRSACVVRRVGTSGVSGWRRCGVRVAWQARERR